MKNLYFKVLLFSLLITCSLHINSLGSTNTVKTFVSNGNLKKAELTSVSILFYAQKIENSAGDSVLDSIPTFHPDLKKRKEPFKAFIYALGPGAIVHGAGHFYAGETSMGFVLLGSEMVGGVLLLAGVASGWEGGGNQGPTREGFPIFFAGAALFFGSWIYDMIKSPLIVQQQNQELLKAKQTSLRFRIRDGDLRILTVWQF
jgi:hypothetical protein